MSETTNNSNKKYQNFRTEETEIIGSIQQIIFNLNKENIFQSAQSIISIFDYSYPYSFNIVISQFILICIFNANNDFDIYFNFMKEVEKFQEINKVKYKIFNAFANLLLLKPGNQETNYPLFKMFEHNILDIKLSKNKPNPYFVHYMSKEEIKKQHDIFKWVLGNMKELSKNDWELHKQLIEEGLNPNEIAQIIRKDEIEKLQEIASQTEFDFNQLIPKSIYERCSFINQYNVSLIDYAAFFSSVKCFKYLLMNGAKVENTGKYAVAGGNLEIIHLCEQNRSSFQNAYEAAIKFHRNDIFNYLYENKIGNIDNLEELGYLCIMLWNIEIFTLLQKNGLKINDYIINNVARSGNLYLIKHFLKEYPIPRDILIFSPKSGNIELVEYILKQKGIDVNVKDLNQYTALMCAAEYGHTEIVKLLLEQEGIDINAKNFMGDTALMKASWVEHTEIVKLLLEQEGININNNGASFLSMFLNNFWKLFNLFYRVFMHATKNNYIKIVKLLLEREGIDINKKDNWGRTALMYASIRNHIDLVSLLLEQERIDINANDKWGNTALMYASEKGNTEIVKLLLEQKGIDINAQDKNGDTALNKASQKGFTEIVDLFNRIF